LSFNILCLGPCQLLFFLSPCTLWGGPTLLEACSLCVIFFFRNFFGQVQRLMCKPITQLRLKYVSTTDLTPDPLGSQSQLLAGPSTMDLGSRAQVCVGGVFSLQKYSPIPPRIATYAIEFKSSLQAPLTRKDYN